MHPRSSGAARRGRARLVGLALLVAAGCSDDTPAVPATTTVAVTTTVAPTTTVAVTTTTARPPTTTTPSTTTVATTSPVTTRAPGALFGAAIGSVTEDALAKLTAALGSPTIDSGWGVGCTLDSPTATNERLVTWQHLRVLFRRDGSSGPGALAGYGYVLPEGDEPAPGDAMLRLALPTGVTLGMPIGQVATAVGATAKVNPTFGWVEVVTPGVTFTADGKDLTAKLDAVSVPRVFSCE